MAGLLLALGGVLVGCGDSPKAQGPGQDDPAVMVGACSAKDAAVTDAQEVATLDLDGNGSDETLRLATEAPCADTLFAISEDQVWSTPVDPAAFEEAARVITRPGEEAELLLVSTSHPRGGFQAKLYGAAGAELGELQVDGKPLLDFVATDVEMPGTAARCGEDGSLVVMTAGPAETSGGEMAYDVFEQSFSVDGLTAAAGERTTVAQALTDPQIRQRYPELLDNTLFEDCAS